MAGNLTIQLLHGLIVQFKCLSLIVVKKRVLELLSGFYQFILIVGPGDNLDF